MKKKIVALTAFFLPLAARAQDLGQKDLNKAGLTVGGYQPNTIEGVIGIVISAALGLLGVIFLVLIVYGGYIWMIARGDEAMVEKAKDTISRSIIGLIIVLAAYAITFFVIDKLISTTIK
jgi:uncharacterized iron-regulated membrane protein